MVSTILVGHATSLRGGTSRCGHQPQQPGRALLYTGALWGRRTSLSAGTGDPGGGAGARASSGGDEPQQPGAALPCTGALWGRRTSLSAGTGAAGAGAGTRASSGGDEPQRPGRA